MYFGPEWPICSRLRWRYAFDPKGQLHSRHWTYGSLSRWQLLPRYFMSAFTRRPVHWNSIAGLCACFLEGPIFNQITPNASCTQPIAHAHRPPSTDPGQHKARCNTRQARPQTRLTLPLIPTRLVPCLSPVGQGVGEGVRCVNLLPTVQRRPHPLRTARFRPLNGCVVPTSW